MDLFTFIEALFDKEKYANIPDSIKRRHFFMVQRFISIRYISEANSFNIIGISQIVAMDFWHMILSKKYSRKPSFLFTKTIKTKGKDKIDKFDHKFITYFIRVTKMNRKDFNFAREIFPDMLFEKLDRLRKMVKDNSIKL